MGMFDEFKFDPNDVSVATSEGYTSAPMQLAYQGSGMMATGLGKLAGFKDEEDLLQEIYETSDFETKEGRNEAIRRIRAVSPEKADEISKQILAEAQTEANIVNTELATESALIGPFKTTVWNDASDKVQVTYILGSSGTTAISGAHLLTIETLYLEQK